MKPKILSNDSDDVKQIRAIKNQQGIVSSGKGPRSTSKISDKPTPKSK